MLYMFNDPVETSGGGQSLPPLLPKDECMAAARSAVQALRVHCD